MKWQARLQCFNGFLHLKREQAGVSLSASGELHEFGSPCWIARGSCWSPAPACLHPSGWQPQHGAYWLVPPSQMGVTGNLDKRALHHFLQFTNNDVKQERSQDRPAALCSLPSPRNKVYDPLTMTLWAQPSKKAAYTSSCPPIQTESSQLGCMNIMGDNMESLAKVEVNGIHLAEVEGNEIQCSPLIHKSSHLSPKESRLVRYDLPLVKPCWRLSFTFMRPQMCSRGTRSWFFPGIEVMVDLPMVPQIVLLAFFKTIICSNLFQIMLCTSSRLRTQHNSRTNLSLLSCGHLFDHSSLPKIVWEGVKWEMLISLWREIPFRQLAAGNPNPTAILPAPLAETQPCTLKPKFWQCWTRRSGSVFTAVTLFCKHVQIFPVHGVDTLPQTVH